MGKRTQSPRAIRSNAQKQSSGSKRRKQDAPDDDVAEPDRDGDDDDEASRKKLVRTLTPQLILLAEQSFGIEVGTHDIRVRRRVVADTLVETAAELRAKAHGRSENKDADKREKMQQAWDEFEKLQYV